MVIVEYSSLAVFKYFEMKSFVQSRKIYFLYPQMYVVCNKNNFVLKLGKIQH